LATIQLTYRITFTFDPSDMGDDCEYGSIEAIAEMHEENLIENPEEFITRFRKMASVEIDEDTELEINNYDDDINCEI